MVRVSRPSLATTMRSWRFSRTAFDCKSISRGLREGDRHERSALRSGCRRAAGPGPFRNRGRQALRPRARASSAHAWLLGPHATMLATVGGGVRVGTLRERRPVVLPEGAPGDLDVFGAVNHVVVGDDQAVVADDESGSEALHRLRSGLWRKAPASPEVLEKLLQGIAKSASSGSWSGGRRDAFCGRHRSPSEPRAQSI